jgi:transposase
MLVYIGIDWSDKKHNICFMNEKGGTIEELEIAHSQKGFEQFDTQRRKAGLELEDCLIGIETKHNQLLDYLIARAYPNIYILPPIVVDANQGRLSASKAKDDRRDARLIADILRTDRHRLAKWQPESPLLQNLRARISQMEYLTESIVGTGNRLQAILKRYYPLAETIFSDVNRLITMAFIQAFPTPEKALQLSYADFTVFLKTHHHSRPALWPSIYTKLQAPMPVTPDDIVQVYANEAVSLAKQIEALLREKNGLLKTTHELFLQHPDHAIYQSLPAAGQYLEAALLAKFGEDRSRFPTAAVAQAVAGTSPVTKRSGKKKYVLFRHACDHEFRNIIQQWAILTVMQAVPWATSYYHQVRPHCSSDNDAYRRLANRWISILWKMWQDGKPYDEAYHLQQRMERAKPRA